MATIAECVRLAPTVTPGVFVASLPSTLKPGDTITIEISGRRCGKNLMASEKMRELGAELEKPFFALIRKPASFEEGARPPCRGCSAPATDGEFCVYCEPYDGHNLSRTVDDIFSAQAMLSDSAHPGEAAARARLAAFDKRNRPRVTAESRELAKPHPWECDE